MMSSVVKKKMMISLLLAFITD